MKNALLASVAVVSLLSFSSAVLAQSMNQGGAKEAPPASSQKSEPPATAPTAKPLVTQSTTTPAPKAGATVEEKAAPKASQQAQEKAAPKAQSDKAAADVNPDAKPSAATTAPAAASTTAKETKAPAASTTTGAAAAGPTAAAAAPPAEKRAQIVSAIKQEKVEAVTNVNFNISIGSMVPSTVRFYSVPSHIVTIYPEWSGYEYILVNGRYLIVRPRTHEIVYIIEG